MIESVAKHCGFDVETPFEQLPEAARQVLLHGSGTQDIEFIYRAEGAKGRVRTVKRWHPFEGIIPNFERRFRETDSMAVREDLARYQAARPCPQCDGTRLRREARHVRLAAVGDANPAAGRAIYEIEHATLAEALAYFDIAAAGRRQGRDRRQGGARDPRAAEVPQRRRAVVPEPGPRRRHAVGRRGAAHPPGLADRLGADRRDVRARRAEHRAAPARQRAADRHAEAPARPRQQRAGGRARRGHDPRRRPLHRPRPRRRRARRRAGGAGHARRRSPRTRRR